MSSQTTATTRPSRRRRIAGERRPSGAPSPEAPAAEEDPTARVDEPAPTADHDPAGPTDDEAGPAAARTRKAVRWQVLVLLAVAALVTVTLAAGPFIPGVGVAAVSERQEQDATAAARRAAPAAAERAAVAILSYDHRRLETDRDQAARFMTSDYRRRYLRTFDGAVLEQAEKLQARVAAEVRASAVTLAEPTRAQVLVFVDQTTTSRANGGEPQVALNRVMLTMEQRDGSWKVDDITSY